MLKLSTSITLMFREYPPLERPYAAAKAGFRGVEIQMMEAPADEMARACADAGVAVALINVAMGDFLMGGAGISGVPGQECVFRSALLDALNAATVLGCANLHLGPSRVPEGTTREACLAVYAENLAFSVPYAAERNVTLLLEPLNRVEAPTALFCDLHSAAAFIADRPALGLQFDAYHVAMNGEGPRSVLKAHKSLVRHVQFSDAPGRHEPGTGAIDFAGLFSDIAADTFEGWTGAEYIPRTATADSLGWLEPLKELGA